MILRLSLVLCLLISALTPDGRAQAVGRAPDLGADARDVGASFKLPPLRDQPDGELAKQLAGLQVGKRAKELKLDVRSAYEAWFAAQCRPRAADDRPAGNLTRREKSA